MHVAALPLRSSDTGVFDWHLINFFTCISFTAVPFFFMMSGYLLLTDEKTKDISTLLKVRLPRLILPLIFWSVTAIIVQLYYSGTLSAGNVFQRCVDALSAPAAVHLWYVYTLIGIYLVSPILYGGLNNLSRGGHIRVLTIILFVALKSILQAISPSFLDRFFEIKLISQMGFFENHLCTFVLGYYLGKPNKKIPGGILILISAMLIGIITFGTVFLSRAHGSYMQDFQNQSAGFEVLLAACIFILFKQTVNKKSRFLSRVPLIPLSLSIYMMHNILLFALEQEEYIAKTFSDTILTSLFIYVVCFIVTKTLATIKPLCFLTTGIPYKKASKTCNWIYTFKKDASLK